MFLQEKADSTPPLGIYFHVPFCASTCDFCAFYQEAPRRIDLERYLEGMETELSRVDFDDCEPMIFWGGGTPAPPDSSRSLS